VQPPKVQPSSLVFVAIVASWAAYLLPRWVVRRDSLGQARARDRHSAQLRVLTRRRRRPAGPSSAPLLTSGRPVPSGTAPRHIAASTAPAGRPVASPSVASPSVARPAPVGTAVGTGVPGTVRTGVPGAVRTGAARRARARQAAVRRARVLGLLLVLTAGSVALVTFTSVPLWTPAPAGTLLLLDLLALVVAGRRRAATRRAVAREVALRTIAAGRRVDAARTANPLAGRGAQVPVAAGAAASGTAAAGTAAGAGRPSRVVAAASGQRAGSVAAEVAAVAAGQDGESHGGEGQGGESHGTRRTASRLVPVPPLREAATASSGPAWTPVAVPPPTYTLKPVARRAEPRALDLTPPAAAPSAPRPWDIDPVTERPRADELDLDLVLARRRAVNG